MPETLFSSRVQSSAVISRCGRYRYRLERQWGATPAICWIMLNPSTADANQDDPTIRRCMGFARSWGAGGIVVVNLFAYRATDPNNLWEASAKCNIVGETSGPFRPMFDNLNDYHIATATAQCRTIAAWGTLGNTNERDQQVIELIRPARIECLGTTKDGYPKHPVRLAGNLKPVLFELGGRI